MEFSLSSINKRRRLQGLQPLCWKDYVRCAVAVVLYTAFLIYIESWWGVIVYPFLIDNYTTKFIYWSWWKDIENGVGRTLMSWVDALVFALVAVYFVNIYFFQNYTIPSSSLEKSLLVGDYLMVSKTSYGARVPQTPLHMPLCQHTLPFGIGKSYVESVQWPYKRVHPKRVSLNDIVVFNFPNGDSVLTEMQSADYYEQCYGIGQQIYTQVHGFIVELDSMPVLQQRRYLEECRELGRQYMAQNKGEFGDLIWRPVDRRENYVKRCVGTPGQTLQIKNKVIYLDGKANKEPDNVQYNYLVSLKYQLPQELIDELELSGEQLSDLYSNGTIALTHHAYEALKARTDLVECIEPEPDSEAGIYPLKGHTGWTRDNYGPVWIPEKGKQIPEGLTLQNLPVYERLITVYEGNKLEVTDEGKIFINGTEAHNYTFQMDYYWMMGDNRHNSADSRYWGFVPEDHVVGKPIVIWMSTNKDRSGLDGIRWERLFRWVDDIK